jgi:hypothetical protein
LLRRGRPPQMVDASFVKVLSHVTWLRVTGHTSLVIRYVTRDTRKLSQDTPASRFQSCVARFQHHPCAKNHTFLLISHDQGQASRINHHTSHVTHHLNRVTDGELLPNIMFADPAPLLAWRPFALLTLPAPVLPAVLGRFNSRMLLYLKGRSAGCVNGRG